MGESKAFEMKQFVVILPTSITAEEIRESIEKRQRGLLSVSKIVLISGAPLQGALGRTIFEDVGSPISGRSQGDGMGVYLVTAIVDVSRAVDLVEKADRLVKEKADERNRRNAEVEAKEAARAAEILQKQAEKAVADAEAARKRLAELTGEGEDE